MRDDGSSFFHAGFALIENGLSSQDLTFLEAHFPDLGPRNAGAREEELASEFLIWLSANHALRELADILLGSSARIARIQAFDKSPGSNWFVPWHQDRAEYGQDRPIALLETMVALRLHLDDCGEDNGPLEVLPGSHVHGRLEADAIASYAASVPPQVCMAARGDILAIRPLLVHRSKRAHKPTARRVVHIEYAAIKCSQSESV